MSMSRAEAFLASREYHDGVAFLETNPHFWEILDGPKAIVTFYDDLSTAEPAGTFRLLDAETIDRALSLFALRHGLRKDEVIQDIVFFEAACQEWRIDYPEG